MPCDMDKQIRLFGGHCGVSVVANGFIFNRRSDSTAAPRSLNSPVHRSSFAFTATSYQFSSRGSSLSTYPVASAYTSARHPRTFARIELKMAIFRQWMNLGLTFRFPKLFSIVVDNDACATYGRIFSGLIKVCCYRKTFITGCERFLNRFAFWFLLLKNCG